MRASYLGHDNFLAAPLESHIPHFSQIRRWNVVLFGHVGSIHHAALSFGFLSAGICVACHLNKCGNSVLDSPSEATTPSETLSQKHLRHVLGLPKRLCRVASRTLLGEPVGRGFLYRRKVACASARATSTLRFARNGLNIPR
jgi:hypothetical protein